MNKHFSTMLLLVSASYAFAAEIEGEKTEELGVPVEIKECTSEHEGDYDLPLHIAAVFIVVGISILGLGIPYVATKVFGKSLQKESAGFKSLKLFGAGVIISTAFVHMMIPAFSAFSDPCLPAILNEEYSAWSAVFVIFGIFLTHLIQIVIRQNLIKRREQVSSVDEKIGATVETGKNERKSSVFVLEAGIAIHSIIIGIILGFAKSEFIALLIALGFHQFFEGLALSTIIIETGFSSLRPMILAFVGYALSTPSGVAIGIICHQLVADYSIQTEIIVTGILEAFGAGILIYDVLVNIIAPHFCEPTISTRKSAKTDVSVEDETEQLDEHGEHVHVSSFVHDSVGSKTVQLVALYLGATVMAVIGKWA